MSFIGLIYGIISLLSSKLVLIINLKYIIYYSPLIMLMSSLLRAKAYDVLSLLAISVILDCICGTMYFPAFDSLFITKIPQKYIGRIMDTVNMIISIVIPIFVINILHSISHRLPFWISTIFSITSWYIHHGVEVQDGGCFLFGYCNRIKYVHPQAVSQQK